MRESIDGPSQIVAAAMGMNPLSSQVFVFIGRRRDCAKLLVWDRHGFWVLYKRFIGTSRAVKLPLDCSSLIDSIPASVSMLLTMRRMTKE
jgi:transposase